ncbi:MAG: nucleoside/nucleotide kinase family protein [Microbacteriaceae bacterium]|nr:nucleoside/nucleotide kinase family protein [Microbacteriaceae bacterium]MCL2794735.1 nucleoside/nucleotide kinase family protein [Microbacteriaceae bacterium]
MPAFPTALLDGLIDRVLGLMAGRPRVVIGIAAPPGAGKSTLAEALAVALQSGGPRPALARDEVAVVPMDGFHLADVTLDALGRRGRKGALDTFDGDGYVAALRRIRAAGPRPIHLPGFERELEQPIAAAITVAPAARVVITEGNYLLMDAEPWDEVAGLLDESWYLDVDDEVRRARLVARHVRFGKSPGEARAWVDGVDEPNAALIAATRGRASLVIAL